MLEPSVLLLLTSTPQHWTEMFSVTFWTSVTRMSFCSPATFCPNLPVWTDHLEKTLLVQTSGSAKSLHPQTLSQAVNPNPLPQTRALTHCVVFFVVVWVFLLSVPEHLQDKKLGLPPWHPACGTALSATPASLTVCVCTENRGIKQLHKHLWGMFHSHSYM